MSNNQNGMNVGTSVLRVWDDYSKKLLHCCRAVVIDFNDKKAFKQVMRWRLFFILFT